MSQSKTVTVLPIAGALVAGEAVLGADRHWQARNEMQKRFLPVFEKLRCEVGKIPELECLLSWEAKVLNQFLRERGFDIALQPFEPDEFGVASVLKVLMKWLCPGISRPLMVNNTQYAGARFGNNGVTFFESPVHTHPIAAIQTESGDVAYMTKWSDALDEFSLLDKAHELRRTASSIYDFGGLHFPMISLDQEVDISWLSGLETQTTARGKPENMNVGQALQQTKFRMNQLAAKVESAVAISITRTSARKPDMVVDEPFLTWTERVGVSYPIFLGHLYPDSWKDHGKIE